MHQVKTSKLLNEKLIRSELQCNVIMRISNTCSVTLQMVGRFMLVSATRWLLVEGSVANFNEDGEKTCIIFKRASWTGFENTTKNVLNFDLWINKTQVSRWKVLLTK